MRSLPHRSKVPARYYGKTCDTRGKNYGEPPLAQCHCYTELDQARILLAREPNSWKQKISLASTKSTCGVVFQSGARRWIILAICANSGACARKPGWKSVCTIWMLLSNNNAPAD